MAKHPRDAFATTSGTRRAPPTDPRYEIVFEKPSSARGALANVLAELKSLGNLGGSAIGDSYALAARLLLNGKERLEDLNAERRLRQRSEARAAASTSAPGTATRPKKPLHLKVSA